jgi:hypothetical protein
MWLRLSASMFLGGLNISLLSQICLLGKCGVSYKIFTENLYSYISCPVGATEIIQSLIIPGFGALLSVSVLGVATDGMTTLLEEGAVPVGVILSNTTEVVVTTFLSMGLPY